MISVSNLQKKYDGVLKILVSVNPDQNLTSVCSENKPQKDALIFISKPEYFVSALQSEAGALIIPSSHSHLVSDGVQKNILTTPNPRLAMALILKEVFAADSLKDQITEPAQTNAIIHSSAKIGKNTLIGPNAFIGKNVTLGDNVMIGTSAVVQEGAVIGSHSKVHELAFVGKNCEVGSHCEIFHQAAIGSEGFGYATDANGNHHPIPHQGKVVLENHVHIGTGTKVDRGTFGETRIGEQTKIDNLCHVAHNCKIGKRGLLAGGFMMAGSTTIGDNFTSGGRATVGGHLTICDNVNIAGFSVVHKSVDKPGSYFGYPLQPLQEGLKNNATHGKLFKMRKDLKKALKKLGITETK